MALSRSKRGLVASLIAFGFAAPAVAEGPTLEQLVAKTSPEELARAFKGICLDQTGNLAAQQAAAMAEPWKMTKEGTSGDETTFTAWPLKAHIGKHDGLDTCVVISAIEDATTIADIVAKAVPLLDPPEQFGVRDDSSLGWEFERDGVGYVVRFKTFQNPGLRTGIFLLGRKRGT